MTSQPEGIKFYWIGLKVSAPQGDAIFLKGPFNTERGRDGFLQSNAALWQASKTEFRPFETIGKKRADAQEMAQNVLNIADTPTEIERENLTGATPRISPVQVEEAAFNRTSDPRTPIAANVPREIISDTPEITDDNSAENIFGSSPGLVEIANEEREKAIGETLDPSDASLTSADIDGESLVDSASNFRTQVTEDLEDEFTDQFNKELKEEGSFNG